MVTLNLRAPVCPGNVASLRSGDILVRYPLLLPRADMLPPHSIVLCTTNVSIDFYADTAGRMQRGWKEVGRCQCRAAAAAASSLLPKAPTALDKPQMLHFRWCI